MTRTIRVVVNGHTHEREVEVRASLADFLREDLDLTGTHVGCEHGVCGACTVLLAGDPIRSCLMLAVQADGHSVTTVEGLAPGDGLHPLQEAFWANHGLQCGYCTPGILLTAHAFLRENPAPESRGDPGDAGREPLPVHRVPLHRRSHPCGGVRGAPAA